MAPSPLHGLNLVQTADSPASDQDLLGGAHNFPPEYAAQLDFWSNLNFQSDEPLSANVTRPGSDSPEDFKDDKDEEMIYEHFGNLNDIYDARNHSNPTKRQGLCL